MSPGSFGFAWVHLGAPSGRGVHLCSCGFTRECLGVLGFIRVRGGSLGGAYVSPGSLVFACVHYGAPLDRRVYSGSQGSLGTL